MRPVGEVWKNDSGARSTWQQQQRVDSRWEVEEQQHQSVASIGRSVGHDVQLLQPAPTDQPNASQHDHDSAGHPPRQHQHAGVAAIIRNGKQQTAVEQLNGQPQAHPLRHLGVQAGGGAQCGHVEEVRAGKGDEEDGADHDGIGPHPVRLWKEGAVMRFRVVLEA